MNQPHLGLSTCISFQESTPPRSFNLHIFHESTPPRSFNLHIFHESISPRSFNLHIFYESTPPTVGLSTCISFMNQPHLGLWITNSINRLRNFVTDTFSESYLKKYFHKTKKEFSKFCAKSWSKFKYLANLYKSCSKLKY